MKMRLTYCFLISTCVLLGTTPGQAEPPEPIDPGEVAPEGSLPGVYPESVTAANVNIGPSPGSILGGDNSDNLKVTFPSAGPIRWTESRHNEGDVALLIGPFDPDDASYYPPNEFVNNYRPLADGEAFANTTLAWRVNRDNGALLATVRHNGVNQQDTFNGSPVGIKHGVAYFNNGFGQGWGFRMNDGQLLNGGEGSADLQMGVAGNDDGANEASFNVAAAYFPYEQGWWGAWVDAPFDEGDATFSHGHPDLEPESVYWYPLDGEEVFNGALARVELPDVNSASDGMLFVASTNDDNSTNIAAGSPHDGGWNVAMREDNDEDVTGQTVTDDLTQLNFQFLYVPYDAGGLIGGHVDGADGSLLNGAGDAKFSLARRAAGEYALSVLAADGQTKLTEDDGMLILSVAGTIDGDPTVPGRAFVSYEFDAASGDFVIQSRELIDTNNPAESENVFGDVLALTDSDFYFAFIDFQNPLTPEPGVSVPGDYNNNGLLDADDLDLQAEAIATATGTPAYDLNNDGSIDYNDRLVWVNDLKKTWIGDANLDDEFNSSDMVQVFASGKYETEERAGWEEGDWNADLKFGSGDMVAAFAAGGYEQGPRLAAAVSVVPEPSSLLLILLGVIPLWNRWRGRG